MALVAIWNEILSEVPKFDNGVPLVKAVPVPCTVAVIGPSAMFAIVFNFEKSSDSIVPLLIDTASALASTEPVSLPA